LKGDANNRWNQSWIEYRRHAKTFARMAVTPRPAAEARNELEDGKAIVFLGQSFKHNIGLLVFLIC